MQYHWLSFCDTSLATPALSCNFTWLQAIPFQVSEGTGTTTQLVKLKGTEADQGGEGGQWDKHGIHIFVEAIIVPMYWCCHYTTWKDHT